MKQFEIELEIENGSTWFDSNRVGVAMKIAFVWDHVRFDLMATVALLERFIETTVRWAVERWLCKHFLIEYNFFLFFLILVKQRKAKMKLVASLQNYDQIIQIVYDDVNR